jgi:hypothetical protein
MPVSCLRVHVEELEAFVAGRGVAGSRRLQPIGVLATTKRSCDHQNLLTNERFGDHQKFWRPPKTMQPLVLLAHRYYSQWEFWRPPNIPATTKINAANGAFGDHPAFSRPPKQMQPIGISATTKRSCEHPAPLQPPNCLASLRPPNYQASVSWYCDSVVAA